MVRAQLFWWPLTLTIFWRYWDQEQFFPIFHRYLTRLGCWFGKTRSSTLLKDTHTQMTRLLRMDHLLHWYYWHGPSITLILWRCWLYFCGVSHRCAYHAWRFDADGKCLSIPQSGRGGKDESQPAACAKVYPTQAWSTPATGLQNIQKNERVFFSSFPLLRKKCTVAVCS